MSLFSLAQGADDEAFIGRCRDVISGAGTCDEMLSALAADGLLGLQVPQQYGGAGAGERQLLQLLTAVSERSPSVANVLGVHSLVAYGCLVRAGSESQRERWLPDLASGRTLGGFAVTEAAAGSDVSALDATLTQSEDGYVLDGDKTYVTAADRAGIFVVAARHVDGPHEGRISAVVVERQDGIGVQALETVGQTDSGLGAVTFDGLTIAPDHVVGEPGRGARVILAALEFDKLIAAASAGAAAAGALRETMRQLEERSLFGGPLSEKSSIQSEMADQATSLLAIESLILRALSLREHGDARASLLAAATKLRGADLALEVGLKSSHLRGIRGYSVSSGTSQLIGDLRGYALAGGTSEIQRIVIDRELRKVRDRVADTSR